MYYWPNGQILGQKVSEGAQIVTLQFVHIEHVKKMQFSVWSNCIFLRKVPVGYFFSNPTGLFIIGNCLSVRLSNAFMPSES